MTTRTTLVTAGNRLLDYNLPPMRLWQKAKQLGVWNPSDVDFRRDREDWLRLSELEQDVLLREAALFLAGEEAVTRDLLPLLAVMSDEGRLEEEIYLTSFLWEEAKHVEAFSRFLHEVVGEPGDLSRFHGPCYRTIFYEELPRSLGRLRTDRSPEAQAVASVTYNLIVEGVLAESGYHAYYEILHQHQLMPGMQQVVEHLKRDESRHLAYGVYLLSRLVAEHGEPVWEVIQTRMNELLAPALGLVGEIFACYEEMPFGLEEQTYLDFATAQFQRRVERIAKARGQTLDAVCAAVDYEVSGV